MKIAIAATENSLEANVAPYFGRCDWLCLYNTETKDTEFIENSYRFQSTTAGTDTAGLLTQNKVRMVVAGRFGLKTVNAFRSNRIQLVVPEKDLTVRELINQLNK